jgi:hypothetical protein
MDLRVEITAWLILMLFVTTLLVSLAIVVWRNDQ